MTSKHLGESVHDLLDGRMTTAESTAAMAHLESCPECNTRFRQLRDAREALNSSSAGIDMRFAQQLLDRDRMATIAKGESKHRAKAASGRRRRPVALVAAVLVFVATGVGAAYYAGAPDDVPVEFASASASASAVGSARSVASMDPESMRSGDSMRAWVHPDWQDSGLVPIEAKVMRAENGAEILIASLFAGNDPIVVTQQHGDLALERVADLPRADVHGIDAYVVRLEPAQMVWQTGDVVISLTCTCALVTLETVAGNFPTNTDPGFFDRLSDGVGELTGTLTGN